jgi:hypothetical protein
MPNNASRPGAYFGAYLSVCADNSMITAQTLVVDGGYSL